MKADRHIDHAPLLAITIFSFVSFGWATALPAAERIPLRILLTNDDGYDAPGIKAVHSTLVAAGHDVIVIAPAANQSGSGVRVTTRGMISYKEQAPGIWSVEGSPADSVIIGLRYLLKDDWPDIVVSGANFGQNLAYGSSSGTVGAATIAMYGGLPAIAISVGINPSERNAKPARFPSTLKAFAGAAELTLNIIDDLQASRVENGGLLPEHTILNVNYPAADPEQIKGVRVVRAGRDIGARISYEETEQPGRLNIRLEMTDSVPTEGGDSQFFALGFATITVLDGDWDAGELLRATISERLAISADQ